MTMKFSLVLFFISYLLPPAHAGTAKPYRGCLLFLDDARKPSDLAIVDSFKPDVLLRSWYRWGEPGPGKSYEARSSFVRELKKRRILLGGGTSLSVVNERDLKDKGFKREWLAVALAGEVIGGPGKYYGTISSPEFRGYLIRKLLAQVKAGVSELHLGETNGDIYFDDWSLGLKGRSGFIQWLLDKYPEKRESWWREYLGEAGAALKKGSPLTRAMFLELSGPQKNNFQKEWGAAGSWHGTNSSGEPAFLAALYRANLEYFISELRMQLADRGYAEVSIDIWGIAGWMNDMQNGPDAFLSTPPDERWGLNWSTDPAFDLGRNKDRILKIMRTEVKTAAPIPLVYMIDHPRPFNAMVRFSDERQAGLMAGLARLSAEAGANFVIRSYSEPGIKPGRNTGRVLRELCDKAKAGKDHPNLQ